MRRIALETHSDHADDTALREDPVVTSLQLRKGDKVFVHRSIFLPTHLRQEAGSKLDYLYYGPIEVLSTPSPNTAELAFAQDFSGHRIVNIRFLKKCPEYADLTRPQPPRQHEILDGHIGYLVDRILKHKKDNVSHFFFFVHWRNYPASARSWEPLEHFCNENHISNDQLRKYISKHKLPIDPDNVYSP